MYIDMDSIESIKVLKENIHNEIAIEMNCLIPKFKKYVSEEHSNNPKHVFIEGIWHRNNYGYKDNYYYCYLSDFVQFIHNYSIWRIDVIFYNDKLNWWFVYDKEKEKYTEYNELDTDSQIALLELLKKRLEID
jgi:hypothetical protein